MAEVKYWLNGKLFKDYGAYVSQSHGLIDIPETKPILTHDWAESDGIEIDMDAEVKYKPRKIKLDMFIRGVDWSAIQSSVNSLLLIELSKKGVQKLEVQPFDNSKLTYYVIQDGAIEINKVFNDGVMFAVLTLSLLEPDPNHS